MADTIRQVDYFYVHVPHRAGEGDAGINVTAIDATCTGGRYGAIWWVAPRDVKKAARVLGAQ